MAARRRGLLRSAARVWDLDFLSDRHDPVGSACSTTFGPKGHGIGSATAEATAVGLSHDHFSLSQTGLTGHRRAPQTSGVGMREDK